VAGAREVYEDTYRVFSYRLRLSFCKEAISSRRLEMLVCAVARDSSSSALRALKRSRWAVIMGRIPGLEGAGGSRRVSRWEPIMEVAGEMREAWERATEDCGYRET